MSSGCTIWKQKISVTRELFMKVQMVFVPAYMVSSLSLSHTHTHTHTHTHIHTHNVQRVLTNCICFHICMWVKIKTHNGWFVYGCCWYWHVGKCAVFFSCPRPLLLGLWFKKRELRNSNYVSSVKQCVEPFLNDTKGHRFSIKFVSTESLEISQRAGQNIIEECSILDPGGGTHRSGEIAFQPMNVMYFLKSILKLGRIAAWIGYEGNAQDIFILSVYYRLASGQRTWSPLTGTYVPMCGRDISGHWFIKKQQTKKIHSLFSFFCLLFCKFTVFYTIT